jgi:predicted nucleic acid-binding protein
MIVVSDTSPILSLALIGRLDLLREIYGSIVIPEAVRQELMVTERSGAQEVSQAAWIITRPTRTAPRSGASVDLDVVLKLLQREVDRGEAEAIGLAVQLNADVLLIDERQARRLAQYLELNIVGLLDVLQEAKQRQLITGVKPVLDDLIARARFRLSHKLYLHTLHTAGELDHAHPT